MLIDVQIVKLLSSTEESKAVINSKDDEGWAPLHSAASVGNAELVEVLLARGLLFESWKFLGFLINKFVIFQVGFVY